MICTMKHTYKKYIFIIITLFFSSYVQCMEQDVAECSMLSLPTETIYTIGTNLDLLSLGRFLCVCKLLIGIDKFLQRNQSFYKNLNSDDHITTLVHYAQTNNPTMFDHVIKHENNNNREIRIIILDYFAYLTHENKMILLDELFNINNNIQAYKAIAQDEKDINSEYFLNTAERNRIYPLKIFLKNNVDINAQNKNGSTALHCASREDHKDIVQLLITKKANINAQSNSHLTPLHLASRRGNKNIVELLILFNADINAQDDDGCTALFMASSQGNKDIVPLLIAHNANINTKSKSGDTALHCASRHGIEDIVELLIIHKADIHATNNDGQTALQIALQKHFEDIVQLLKNAGAH
jgi:ankyrin repeat protein